MSPSTRRRRPGARRRRWPRRAATAVAAIAVLSAGAGVVAWGATPAVSDAPTLVARAVADRGETSDGGAVPAKVAAALVATEDEHFYSDFGVDPYSVARVLRDAVEGGQPGGAGIAQQLAKMLWTPDRHDTVAEAEQLTLAVKLDARYSRQEILAMYLDEAYFGDNQFGIVDAARHYFGVPSANLTWGQASMLAGLVQAPTAYDPHGHLALARLRERHVLGRLVATGVLTAAQSARAFAAPLHPVISFSG